VVADIASFLLYMTAFGRLVYAIGSNREGS
jgi:ribose/xylose/arabinose/galactoside ABC-type transport system permease subunit